MLASLTNERTGREQVIDAATVDGAAYLLLAQFCKSPRVERNDRGTSILSGVEPFCTVYQCFDGGSMPWVPTQQYSKGLGLDDVERYPASGAPLLAPKL